MAIGVIMIGLILKVNDLDESINSCRIAFCISYFALSH